MRHHETLWDIVKHYERPWYIMLYRERRHESPWDIMRHHDTSCYIVGDAMSPHETSWDTMIHYFDFSLWRSKKYLHRGLHLALNLCTVGYVLHWIFVHGDYFSSWIFVQVFFALNLWTGGYYLTWIFVQMNTSCIESMHRGLFRVVTLCTDVDYFLP
jgi:hypothetical protein